MKEGFDECSTKIARILLALAALFLGACAASQQREINAAFVAAQQSKATAAEKCANSPDVASCMLGLAAIYGAGSGSAPPLVASDLQQWTGLAGVVVPGLSSVKQAGYARDTAINAQNNATIQSGQQWTGISSIVGSATTAQASTAGAAINGMANLGSAALQAQSATATAALNANAQVANGATQALGLGFLALPDLAPTITAGGNVVQGDGNDLSTRRDTLTAGTELRYGSHGPFSAYEWLCTAAPAGNGANGGSGANGSIGGAGGASTQNCTFAPIQ